MRRWSGLLPLRRRGVECKLRRLATAFSEACSFDLLRCGGNVPGNVWGGQVNAGDNQISQYIS
jgi:hypothetical protein